MSAAGCQLPERFADRLDDVERQLDALSAARGRLEMQRLERARRELRDGQPRPRAWAALDRAWEGVHAAWSAIQDGWHLRRDRSVPLPGSWPEFHRHLVEVERRARRDAGISEQMISDSMLLRMRFAAKDRALEQLKDPAEADRQLTWMRDRALPALRAAVARYEQQASHSS